MQIFLIVITNCPNVSQKVRENNKFYSFKEQCLTMLSLLTEDIDKVSTYDCLSANNFSSRGFVYRVGMCFVFLSVFVTAQVVGSSSPYTLIQNRANASGRYLRRKHKHPHACCFF